MKTLTIITLVLLLTACGGSDGTSTDPANTPAPTPGSSPDPAAASPVPATSPSSNSGGSNPIVPSTSSGPGPAVPPETPAPVVPPADPVAPAQSAPTPVYSPYEGVWLGVSYYNPSFQAPNYPGFIVDADGYYWSESINWMETDFGFMTGQITSDSMTVIEGGIIDGSGLFADQLSVTSVSASSGQLTLEGSLSGVLSEGNGQFGYAGGPFQTLPYSANFTLLTGSSTPKVSLLAGSYPTFWGGTLVINPDGTFTLDDNGNFASNAPSAGCTYAGTITIKDPNTNVYSITGTTTAPWLDNDGATLPVVGVFTVSANGQLQGGITDGNGSECTTTVDSISS